MTLLTFTAYALDGLPTRLKHILVRRTVRATVASSGCLAGSVPPVGDCSVTVFGVYLLAGEHIIALLTSLTQIHSWPTAILSGR